MSLEGNYLSEKIDKLRVENERLQRELQAAKQDSELLDWLEENAAFIACNKMPRNTLWSCAAPQTLRAAIKAAQAGRVG